jgi:hypothetical protein
MGRVGADPRVCPNARLPEYVSARMRVEKPGF